MNKRLIILISLRFLISSKGTTLLLSAISLLGIFLSTTALLLTTGLFHGFEVSLKDKILSTTSHLVITSVGGNIDDVYGKVKKIPSVREAIPFTLYTGAVSSEGIMQVVNVKAVDYKNEDFRKRIERFLVDGNIDERGILIGDGLATTLGVLSGDKILVISPLARRGVVGFIPKTREFKVSGLFSFGSFEHDFGLIIMEKERAKKLFGKKFSLEGIEVFIDDPYNAEPLKIILQSEIGEGFIVRSWIDLHKTLFSALQMEKIGLFTVLLLMVAVSSFNIMSLLFIKMREKIKDIAILKTYGMTSKDILSIFLLQGIIICVTGLIAGTIASYISGFFINEYKLISVPSEIYLVDHIPVVIELPSVILTIAGAVGISFIISLIPARKASKERIGRILRNE